MQQETSRKLCLQAGLVCAQWPASPVPGLACWGCLPQSAQAASQRLPSIQAGQGCMGGLLRGAAGCAQGGQAGPEAHAVQEHDIRELAAQPAQPPQPGCLQEIAGRMPCAPACLLQPHWINGCCFYMTADQVCPHGATGFRPQNHGIRVDILKLAPRRNPSTAANTACKHVRTRFGAKLSPCDPKLVYRGAHITKLFEPLNPK